MRNLNQLFAIVLVLTTSICGVSVAKVRSTRLQVTKVEIAKPITVSVAAMPQKADLPFNRKADCREPYRSETTASLCIATEASKWSLFAFLATAIGLIVTSLIGYFSFDAAKKSAEAAARSLEANRAWVIPEDMKISHELAAMLGDDGPFSDVISLVIPLKNFGISPALKVTAICCFGVEANKQIHFHGKPNTTRRFAAMRPDKVQNLYLTIKEDDGRQIINGPRDCYIQLEVGYHDAFSPSGSRSYKGVYKIKSEQVGPDSYFISLKDEGDAVIK